MGSVGASFGVLGAGRPEGGPKWRRRWDSVLGSAPEEPEQWADPLRSQQFALQAPRASIEDNSPAVGQSWEGLTLPRKPVAGSCVQVVWPGWCGAGRDPIRGRLGVTSLCRSAQGRKERRCI